MLVLAGCALVMSTDTAWSMVQGILDCFMASYEIPGVYLVLIVRAVYRECPRLALNQLSNGSIVDVAVINDAGCAGQNLQVVYGRLLIATGMRARRLSDNISAPDNMAKGLQVLIVTAQATTCGPAY